MTTPLVVVTGVDPVAMDAALVSLSWDLPGAVSLRHRIDPHSQVLTRTVSDVDGLVEEVHIALVHSCATCALREDIVPTLARLADSGRWSSIVACLPVAVGAERLAGTLRGDDRLRRMLSLRAVVTTAEGSGLEDGLLGDDLLRERGRHTHPGDDRGFAEVHSALIEFADVVVLDGNATLAGADLVRALARPDAAVVKGHAHLDGAGLLVSARDHEARDAWRSPEAALHVDSLGQSEAWRLVLSSSRAFHPARLLAQIDRLGSGRHRSRGCFWLPTRPTVAQEWSGGGGQLSIGPSGAWGHRDPVTRIMFTGLGRTPTDLIAAFEDVLLTADEELDDTDRWRTSDDGLEPWLGDIPAR